MARGGRGRKSKPTDNVVIRHFYFDELHKKNGGEPRFGCVLYQHNRETGETFYGASIYRRRNDDKIPGKKDLKMMLRKTAFKRFDSKPVHITLKCETRYELHQNLRKALFKYGVSGETIGKTSGRNVPMSSNKGTQNLMNLFGRSTQTS